MEERSTPKKAKYVIDASGKVLGRLASEIVTLLRGKYRVGFLPYREPKEEVVVFNTGKIKVTGRKIRQKAYIRHSGYPGSLKEESLARLFERDSREVLRRAVYGMLPKNRTRDKIIKNLKLYKRDRE